MQSEKNVRPVETFLILQIKNDKLQLKYFQKCNNYF